MKVRRWIASMTMAISISACASSAPTRAVAPAAAPAPAASLAADSGTASDPALRCSGGVQLVAPTADAVCKSQTEFWGGSCYVPLLLIVRNCSDAPIDVRQLVLSLGGGHTVEWEFDAQQVLPGKEWNHERKMPLRPGEYDAVVTYSAGDSEPRQVHAVLEVLDSARAAAEEACRECNGDFGPHGRRGIIACYCRTKDGGKPCKDGRDCEGKCVASDGGFVCSEFPTVFGCYSYLPDGWSEQPHPAPSRIPHICVD